MARICDWAEDKYGAFHSSLVTETNKNQTTNGSTTKMNYIFYHLGRIPIYQQLQCQFFEQKNKNNSNDNS
jgi:hypothetical protein